jgi:hypothetical protein
MAGERGQRVHPFLASRLENPEIRARVEAAERLGISVRRFDGWEPQTVTVYRYRKDGRIKKTITVTEPEYDEHDRAWMLALSAYRAAHCPHCGGALHETTDPANEFAYHADSIRCFKCTALAKSADALTKGPMPAQHPQAVLHRAEFRAQRG